MYKFGTFNLRINETRSGEDTQGYYHRFQILHPTFLKPKCLLLAKRCEVGAEGRIQNDQNKLWLIKSLIIEPDSLSMVLTILTALTDTDPSVSVRAILQMDSAGLLDGDIFLSTRVILFREQNSIRARVKTINSDAGSARFPPTGNLGSTMVICSDR